MVADSSIGVVTVLWNKPDHSSHGKRESERFGMAASVLDSRFALKFNKRPRLG
jgi:hypothetical protein